MSLLTPGDSAPLPRRDFIKLVLAGSAGVAATSCHRQTRALAPLLIPEEQLPSGVAFWSRGLCRQCDAGCGVLVKRMEAVVPLTIEGKPFRQSRLVAKKLEGNPDHPLNRGGLCARGQAALEATYHPMRLREPLRRAGARGRGVAHPIPWADALATLRREIAANPGGVAWLGRPLHGTEAELVGAWLQRLGARWWEYRALPAPRAAGDEARLSRLAEADFLLSFGNFLEGWPAQAATTRAYSRFRRRSKGVFFQVEPRLSLTASNADRWIAVRPGTEGVFALGVAAVLLGGRPPAGHGPTPPAGLDAYTPAAVEQACDVPAGSVRETARALAAARAPLVVGGPAAYARPDGDFQEQAIAFLAALADTGSATHLSPMTDAARAGAPAAASQGAADRFRPTPLSAPLPEPPRLLIVHEANPLFAAPPGWGLAAWLRSIPAIAVLGTLPDETVLQADLVLPLSTTLEGWTDDERRAADGTRIATLNPPAMRPLHDTRSLLDIVAALDGSASNGGRGVAADSSAPADPAAPADAAETALRRRWRSIQAEDAPGREFGDFWAGAVERGGSWATGAPAAAALPPAPGAGGAPPQPGVGTTAPAPLPPPAREAVPSDYPLHLRLYESPIWGDGAGSLLTWLQELPDPTTSAMWSSWVEVHPELAQRLGLGQGDGVWVESSAGRIELPVFLYPGLRPDTVAIPTGQGHGAAAAVAGRGANPFALLLSERDRQTGTLAWEATRVRLTPSGRRPALPLFGRSLQNPVTHR